MKRVIGIIASDIELKQRIERLYSSDIENGNIIIDILNLDLLEEQGKILVEKGAQAIIGRGGGYNLILDTVNVPVIPLNMKVIDLLKYIKVASTYSKKIVLVLGYDEVYFDYDEWRPVIDVDLTEEWFKSKFEIREKVLKYLNQKDDVVIVGGGIACSFARQYGMDSVFINASDNSIKEAIDYCKNLLDSLENEKFHNEVLRNILDGIKDGIIAIDSNGSVLLYNESISKILNIDKKEVLNRNILEVLPSMGWILECLRTNKNSDGKIRTINNFTVNTSATLIKVDDDTCGVLGIIQDITKLQKLERKIRFDLNKKGMYARYTFDDFIFKDEITKEFIKEAKKIGKTDYTVLLYGESGSGKEILAHSIHNISRRKEKPFVAVNCATISESLLESELFGYEEGAFTGARKGGKPGLFELAHGGTLFLDEINSLSLNFQAKLLRVIEERQIMRIGSDYIVPLDIRIIAATNESLHKKIKEGTFRADLFYRLSSLEVDIPPLRERKEDIILLFNNFVNEILKSEEKEYLDTLDKIYNLTDCEVHKLKEYNWPGNVREVKNVAQKYVITGKVRLNECEYTEGIGTDLDNNIRQISDRECIELNKMSIDIKQINRYVEEKVIDILLKQGLSKGEVAQILGISRTSLWKKYNKNT